MEQHSEAGGLAVVDRRSYAIVIEWAETNYSAYVPDVPGCVTTGATIEETVANMREALEAHLAVTIEYGEPLPATRAVVTNVDVAIGGNGTISTPSDTQAANKIESPSPTVRDPGTSSRGSLARYGFEPFGGIDFSKLSSNAMIADEALKAFGGMHVWSLDPMLFANFHKTTAIVDDFVSNSGLASLVDVAGFFAGQYKGVSDALASLGSAHVKEMLELASEVAQRALDVENTGTYVVALNRRPEIPFVYQHTDDADYLAAVVTEEHGENVVILAAWRVEDGKLIG